MSISALVLAKNEEEMIASCLKQLDFGDEIIVLDQGSNDKTIEIAKKFTKKIFSTTTESFAKNREILASYAQGDWLLYIDADERINKETLEEIKKSVKEKKYSAYYFPRKNIILGKWLKHGGWWPDYVPRLFEKNSLVGWRGKVHESPQVNGEFGYLKNPITHLTARNLNSMLQKTIKWAKIEAGLAHEANHPKVTIPKVIWASLKEFVQRYFIKLGLLDGFVGFIEAVFQGLHKAAVLVYLWELQNDTRGKFLRAQESARHE